MNRIKQSINSVEMRTLNLTTMTLGAIFAFLLLISFSPAHAMRDGGYLSVSGGVALITGEVFGVKYSDLFDPGFNIEFAGGSYLGSNWRLEGMFSYSGNEATQVSGRFGRVLYQANAYYSLISAPSPHELFIGAGIGGLKNVDFLGATSIFAFNVGAGYNYFINDSFALGASYRLVGGTDVADIQLHSIQAVVTLAF